jgi:hypothetical protein
VQLGISAGTVSGASGRATALGLDREAMALLSDDAPAGDAIR